MILSPGWIDIALLTIVYWAATSEVWIHPGPEIAEAGVPSARRGWHTASRAGRPSTDRVMLHERGAGPPYCLGLVLLALFTLS
jgi:hypothetical protein